MLRYNSMKRRKELRIKNVYGIGPSSNSLLIFKIRQPVVDRQFL